MSKIDIAYGKIKLIPASLDDYPTLQNMGHFYVYDMSEYLGNEAGWEIPEDGLYECIDFKKYWRTDSAFPFLIRYKNELVGFFIVDQRGSDEMVDYNIGRFVARYCFYHYDGIWEVMIIPGNQGAYQFWKSVITEYTDAHYTEYKKHVKHLSNNEKNIFRFNSVKI